MEPRGKDIGYFTLHVIIWKIVFSSKFKVLYSDSHKKIFTNKNLQ